MIKNLCAPMVLLYGIMYIYVNLLKLLKGLHKILQKIYKLGGLWHFFFYSVCSHPFISSCTETCRVTHILNNVF